MLFINHREVSDGAVSVIEIKGPLNTATSRDFEEYIDKLLEKGSYHLVFDAGSLEHVSSEGIGVMLYVQKKLASRNGSFVICGLSGEILALYKLLGFDKVLSLAADLEEALHILEQQKEMRHTTPAGAPPADIKTPLEPSAVSQADDGASDFQSPLIVECAECKGLIRVKKGGAYHCPYCHAEFSVEKDRTIIF